MNLWGTPAVAGRASPSHPAEVHAAERLSSLRPFTSSWVAAPLRRAGGKIDDGTFSILARDRHRDNGEVRRLGFAPIPSRRSNPNPGAFRCERDLSRWCGHTPASEDDRLTRLPFKKAGLASGRARNSFSRTGEFVSMAAVGHGGIGGARKNIGGAK